jgi:two-component system, cell cycle sensor histidine kinase and response regulator CckA
MKSEAGPRRVLVVDSEDLVRVLLARMLRDCGYDVVEAANGRVALDLVNAGPPRHFDLIVTNSRLPGLNGFEFIAQVLTQYPHLQVLHVTGHPESLQDGRLDQLDRVTTLVKPFSRDDLREAVERCLEAGLQGQRSEGGAFPAAGDQWSDQAEA